MQFVAYRYTTANVPIYTWPADDLDFESDPSTSADWKDTEVILIQSSDTQPARPLRELTPYQFLNRFPVGYMTGAPVCWTKEGNAFRIGPTPNVSTYKMTVWGWRFPGELTDDADTNWATQHLSRLIDLWATAYSLEYFGEPERGNRLRQEAESELQFQIMHDKARQTPAHQVLEPSTIAGRPASGVRRGGAGVRYGVNYFG